MFSSYLLFFQAKRGHNRSHSSASSHSSGSKSSQLVEEDSEVSSRVTSPRPRVQTNESTSSASHHSSELQHETEGEKREGECERKTKCVFEERRRKTRKNLPSGFILPQGQAVVAAEMNLK